MLTQRLEQVLSVVLTVCVVLVTGIFIHERFVRSNVDTADRVVKEWEGLLDGGLRLGSADAPVQVVEFIDFQCPFCKQFHRGLDSVMSAMPGSLAVIMYQYPIPTIHPEAVLASKAAICGNRHGALATMVRVLFENQNQLRQWTFNDYSSVEGIDDATGFEECLQSEEVDSIVAEEKALGQRIGVTGTPTIILDGRLYPGGLPADSLARIVARRISVN